MRRTIREAINMILWGHRERLSEYSVVVVDRLAEGGLREIPFAEVMAVDGGYLYVGTGGEARAKIPLHRVVKIVARDGTVVWER